MKSEALLLLGILAGCSVFQHRFVDCCRPKTTHCCADSRRLTLIAPIQGVLRSIYIAHSVELRRFLYCICIAPSVELRRFCRGHLLSFTTSFPLLWALAAHERAVRDQTWVSRKNCGDIAVFCCRWLVACGLQAFGLDDLARSPHYLRTSGASFNSIQMMSGSFEAPTVGCAY